MAGTTLKRKVTTRTPSAERETTLQLNATIGDLETLRAATAGAFLTGSATYDPASLTDGTGATTTVTVTGAALGDYVVGVSFSVSLQGILLTGYVSAADTVSVRFQNESGGTLDLASGTLRALVLSQAAASPVAAAALLAAKVGNLQGVTT